mgnify:CR=1 FL=1
MSEASSQAPHATNIPVVRTRFAPSPTGFMHIGNLRTALYAYLLAKSEKLAREIQGFNPVQAGQDSSADKACLTGQDAQTGQGSQSELASQGSSQGHFILRIEDTDQNRLVEGATDLIYQSLAICGLAHDEGPDLGGPCGPYVQSQRLDHYLPWAQELVKKGKAYYCFCPRTEEASEVDGAMQELVEDSDGTKDEASTSAHALHQCACRDLSFEEAQEKIAAGTPWVIRQKMPKEGTTSYDDLVFGPISVANEELEDQILIKSDGFPTYNFANVVDDHEMGITHVVRGTEYLSSTPKYILLYEAFGWEVPAFVHLPLILGEDGKKLSKRHGSTSLADLIAEGYLPEAIVNYLAFLGWSPGTNEEIFSLEELKKVFDVHRINNSPAVFNYTKLAWYNGEYLKKLSPDVFADLARPALEKAFGDKIADYETALTVLQTRIATLAEIPEKFEFVQGLAPFDPSLYTNKRQKLTPALAQQVISATLPLLADLPTYSYETLNDLFQALPAQWNLKMGQVMGALRLGLTNQKVTPGGPPELAAILGKEETMRRLQASLEYLQEINKENEEGEEK